MPIIKDSAETKVYIRRVKGAQAEGAKLRLGLIKVTKPSAKELWEKGISLVLVGNNVNDYHFFSGFRLALRVDTKKAKQEMTFDAYINNCLFYLDRELGNAISFFVFKDELAVSLRDASSVKKGGMIT